MHASRGLLLLFHLGRNSLPLQREVPSQSKSAAEACDSEKVKFNGLQAKASRTVHIGDEYEVKTEAKRWRIKVTGLIEKRVANTEAIKNYIDITPPEEMERIKFQAASFHTGKRQSKIGRPTKKERRDLDEFLED